MAATGESSVDTARRDRNAARNRLNYVVIDGREARVRTQASLESYSSCPRSCTNPLPAGTKCAVVDEVTLDCGTARCRLTRPVEGWVNRADLVPLEGDVFVVG